jgi:hypothetical protein
MWETHPEWLRPSRIPLTIICGPPCSGKTTYVNQHKADGDIIIDLDAICMKLQPGYQHWSSRGDEYRGKLIGRAIRLRNIMLARLPHAQSGRGWFIVSAPCPEEQDWWKAKLGGEVLLLNPGLQECKRRALARGTPRAVAGIDDWYDKSERAWHAPVMHTAIGVDGYPRA